MSKKLWDLDKGDKIILSDREKPLIVKKIRKASGKEDKLKLNIPGGGKRYAKIAIGLEGPQGGDYTIFESYVGDVFISQTFVAPGLEVSETNKEIEIEEVL